jgi:ADP-ribose pyrophosphatase
MSIIHCQTELYRGRVFRLVREKTTLVNGLTTEIDVVRHPGAVVIVPVTDEDSVILLRQYRHAVGRYLWELPAGTLRSQERLIDCAHRELAEETGYRCMRMEKITTLVALPGYSDERLTLFLATKLNRIGQKLDPDEIVEVHELPLARAREMLFNGSIIDTKTISGLTLAFHRLGSAGR